MKIEAIEKIYNSATEDYKLLGKDQQLATWAMMNGQKLIVVAKAADKYFTEDIEFAKGVNPKYFSNYIAVKKALEELEKS